MLHCKISTSALEYLIFIYLVGFNIEEGKRSYMDPHQCGWSMIPRIIGGTDAIAGVR